MNVRIALMVTVLVTGLAVLMTGPASNVAMAVTMPDSSQAADRLLIPAPGFPLAGHVYVVDPGHGGEDTGTKRTADGRVWYEKQFTLGLAIELAAQIHARGGTVVNTILVPDSLVYLPFGENRVPAVGAEYFNLRSKPRIVAKAAGLSQRLFLGSVVQSAYPNAEVHWISVHFDFVRAPKNHDPVSGTRIIYASESQETTTVKVQRIIRGQAVTRDSIVAIEPSAFARHLAEAFQVAGWLRDQDQRPVVVSGQRGVKRLFILRAESDPWPKGRGHRHVGVYNGVLDRILIEYANFRSDEDWQRLHQAQGSLHRLAEITVEGLVRDALADTTAH